MKIIIVIRTIYQIINLFIFGQTQLIELISFMTSLGESINLIDEPLEAIFLQPIEKYHQPTKPSCKSNVAVIMPQMHYLRRFQKRCIDDKCLLSDNIVGGSEMK